MGPLAGRGRSRASEGAAKAQSGFLHLSARLQPALEAAEIARVGITHFPLRVLPTSAERPPEA